MTSATITSIAFATVDAVGTHAPAKSGSMLEKFRAGLARLAQPFAPAYGSDALARCGDAQLADLGLVGNDVDAAGKVSQLVGVADGATGTQIATGEAIVKMTLTTMGCPLADVITDNIHDALADVEEVKNVEVKLVWYPAWTTDRMSRYARIALGIR